MIFTRDQARTLHKTGKVTFTLEIVLDENNEQVPCPYTAGDHRTKATILPVRTRVGHEPMGYAKVIGIQALNFEWHITVRDHELPYEPRLLAAYSPNGYVSEVSRALRDEPEAVPETYQERLAWLASDRNDDLKQKRIAEMRRGIDNAAAGLEPAALTRLDRKDIERINFYMSRIEERAGLDTEMDEAA